MSFIRGFEYTGVFKLLHELAICVTFAIYIVLNKPRFFVMTQTTLDTLDLACLTNFGIVKN